MTKCDFCKNEKRTKKIHTTSIDDNSIEYNICEECAEIECPFVNWNNLSEKESRKISDVKCIVCGINTHGSKNFPKYKLVLFNDTYKSEICGDICKECGDKLIEG